MRGENERGVAVRGVRGVTVRGVRGENVRGEYRADDGCVCSVWSLFRE